MGKKICVFFVICVNTVLNAGNIISGTHQKPHTQTTSLHAMQKFVEYGVAELKLYDFKRMLTYLHQIRANNSYKHICKTEEEFNSLYALVSTAHAVVEVAVHHKENIYGLTLEDMMLIYCARMEQKKLLALQLLA